jgi:hypothetical protein
VFAPWVAFVTASVPEDVTGELATENSAGIDSPTDVTVPSGQVFQVDPETLT